MVDPMFYLCFRYVYYAFNDQPTTPERLASSYLVGVVCRALYYLNFQTNFLLYCISGSRFRRDVISVFKTCFPRKYQQKETSVNVMSSMSTTMESL